MSARNKEEEALQIDATDYLLLVLPADAIFHHSPNEGFRHVNFKVKLKKMGTRSGWLDHEIMYRGRGFFLEYKKPGRWNGKRWVGRGKLTASQEIVVPLLRAAGCPVVICYTLEDVQEALWGWGIVEKRAA